MNNIVFFSLYHVTVYLSKNCLLTLLTHATEFTYSISTLYQKQLGETIIFFKASQLFLLHIKIIILKQNNLSSKCFSLLIKIRHSNCCFSFLYKNICMIITVAFPNSLLSHCSSELFHSTANLRFLLNSLTIKMH